MDTILGMIAFLTAVGLPKKLRTLSRVIEGDKSMSRILKDLIGKKVSLARGLSTNTGVVIDADEDCVKLESDNKKNVKLIRIYPIESIGYIEVLN